MSLLTDGDLVLGLDPSLNSSGVCIYKNGSPYHYECIVPYPLEEIDRLQSNYLSYKKLFSTYRNIKCIAFECQIKQMRYNKYAGNILPLAENIGILKLAIAESALIYNPEMIILAIPPGDIKKFATGKSNADKEDMINAVNGHHIKSIRTNIPDYSVNDVADAYHIAKMATKLLSTGEYKQYLYQEYKRGELCTSE